MADPTSDPSLAPLIGLAKSCRQRGYSFRDVIGGVPYCKTFNCLTSKGVCDYLGPAVEVPDGALGNNYVSRRRICNAPPPKKAPAKAQ